MDDVDRSVWGSIMLANLLSGLNSRVWEAIQSGKHVGITIDGRLAGEFIPHDGTEVLVEIDGHLTADVDLRPAPYPEQM